MKEWADFTRAGARITVLGLTTDDNQYSWMASPGSIYKPEWKAREEIPKFRGKTDNVIALTHMGVAEDKNLAAKVNGLDLIVGGHSHTALQTPVMQRDPAGRIVPIVQTGMHGNFVGDLLVDIQPGKPLAILRYQLVPVYSNGPRDAALDQIEHQARDRLNADYGEAWLKEVVGQSEVPLENSYYKDEPTAWSDFVGNAILDAGEADAAIDISQFEGFDQPAGPITREQLFVLYPRIFEFSHRFGYTVWTTLVRGWILDIALKQVYSQGLPINPIGIQADVDSQGNASNLRVAGQPIQSMRNYRIAFPEAVVRGAYGISRYLKLLLKDAHDTGIPIWTATENRLHKIGGVIRARPPAAGL
jgi:2',3'-cyclic-nucleotide 2'-phosphodiesterase (5'-nucleotidase family)